MPKRISRPQLWEKIVLAASIAAILITVLWLTVAIPRPTDTQWFVFRVILAIAAAGVGAVLPGRLSIEIKPFVRATGALALFVIVYLINPPNLISSRSRQAEQIQHVATVPSASVILGGRIVNARNEAIGSASVLIFEHGYSETTTDDGRFRFYLPQRFAGSRLKLMVTATGFEPVLTDVVLTSRDVNDGVYIQLRRRVDK